MESNQDCEFKYIKKIPCLTDTVCRECWNKCQNGCNKQLQKWIRFQIKFNFEWNWYRFATFNKGFKMGLDIDFQVLKLFQSLIADSFWSNSKRISNGLSRRDFPTSMEEFMAWAERLSKWQAGDRMMLSMGNTDKRAIQRRGSTTSNDRSGIGAAARQLRKIQGQQAADGTDHFFRKAKMELVMHVEQRLRLLIERRVVKDKQDQKKQITPKRCVTW
ncbi:hypothetical protein DFJ73DRAFT_771798 [Zopfochytrium polystomum]|nr:hypothetical protein DFJ73DRAFT_771798 [Zopfochytrium polystomum]